MLKPSETKEILRIGGFKAERITNVLKNGDYTHLRLRLLLATPLMKYANLAYEKRLKESARTFKIIDDNTLRWSIVWAKLEGNEEIFETSPCWQSASKNSSSPRRKKMIKTLREMKLFPFDVFLFIANVFERNPRKINLIRLFRLSRLVQEILFIILTHSMFHYTFRDRYFIRVLCRAVPELMPSAERTEIGWVGKWKFSEEYNVINGTWKHDKEQRWRNVNV